MVKKKRIDFILTAIVATLLLMGTMVLFSVSAPVGKQKFGDSFHYLKYQFLFGIIPGTALGVFLYFISSEKLKKFSLVFFVGNILLAAAVFLPQAGIEIGGAKRWIKVGSFSFQPAEFLKITLPLYLAVWLEKQKKKDFIVPACMVLILAPVTLTLIAQPDISSLAILLCLALFVYFLSEAPILHLAALSGICTAGFLALIHFSSYRLSRLLVFLNPKIDPLGIGYQIRQSKIAIGSGGIWGKGFGLSKHKFGYLSNVISDTIFPALCEEAGLVGAFLLIFLFLLFLTRVVTSAVQVKDQFAKTLSITLGLGIALQAFLNIGAMTGLIPLSGIPLPFFSYGGTHLLVEMASCGLILKLTKK